MAKKRRRKKNPGYLARAWKWPRKKGVICALPLVGHDYEGSARCRRCGTLYDPPQR